MNNALETARKQLANAGIDPASATRAQISQHCAVTDNRAKTLQKHLRKDRASLLKGDATRPSNAATAGAAEQHDVKGDTWEISLPRTGIHTLEQLLDYCQVDQKVWTVERFLVNKWEMGSKDDAGNPQTTPLYQVKAWLKRNSGMAAIQEELALLKAEAKNDARVYPAVKRAPSSDGYMLEISIPDLHIGKMAWGKETGHDNYDVKIARQCFHDALLALIERTKSYKFEQIVLVLGNDLLHTDNRQGTTEAGTPMDTDGRYHKSFLTARLMVTEAIELLRQIAPVVVKMVPGNHDYLSVWHLGDSLECTFAKCPGVTIDNSPTSRKYLQFGKVMLMFAHGNKGKLTDYPLVMATEQPKMFGATVHREAHTGDKHTTKVQEFHGVKVRISPALCAPDNWHTENLFVGNARAAEAFVWHREEGLTGMAIYTVPKAKAEAA